MQHKTAYCMVRNLARRAKYSYAPWLIMELLRKKREYKHQLKLNKTLSQMTLWHSLLTVKDSKDTILSWKLVNANLVQLILQLNFGHPVSLKEIGYLILALPSDKAPGEDYISGDLLKTIIVWWKSILAKLFNNINCCGLESNHSDPNITKMPRVEQFFPGKAENKNWFMLVYTDDIFLISHCQMGLHRQLTALDNYCCLLFN
ncbi:Retrovirus-related Pol polyprotein LINE-1, partial [Ophiophagus hannah]